jgi:thiamine biosynthesis lipoprotein
MARATFGVMQASRRWWVVLLVLLAASVWTYRTRTGAGLEVSRFGGPAQGTTYSVVLGHARTPAVIAALQRSVDSVFADIDRRMSTYDPGSELSRFNRDTGSAPFPVSAALATVMQASAQVSAMSGGAFDVTVGPLVDAWGFGVPGDVAHAPTDSALNAIKARVGWQKVMVSGTTLSKRHPHVEVDVSAIAPGYSADVVSALLTARGEPDHFVEVGGEVRAQGVNSDGGPFRVGIEEPDPDSRRIRLVVGLSNKALATSGNYRDNRILDGVRYTHILDPTTGVPVKHALLSVSVLHDECMYADAWATALFSVGPEKAWTLAAQHGLDVLLLTAGPNGEVLERMTEGFRAAVVRDGGPVDRTTRKGSGISDSRKGER